MVVSSGFNFCKVYSFFLVSSEFEKEVGVTSIAGCIYAEDGKGGCLIAEGHHVG